MDFKKVPVGFGMALAQNADALNAYAGMNKEQKRAVLEKAQDARSKGEMRRIVDSIGNGGM